MSGIDQNSRYLRPIREFWGLNNQSGVSGSKRAQAREDFEAKAAASYFASRLPQRSPCHTPRSSPARFTNRLIATPCSMSKTFRSSPPFGARLAFSYYHAGPARISD